MLSKTSNIICYICRANLSLQNNFLLYESSSLHLPSKDGAKICQEPLLWVEAKDSHSSEWLQPELKISEAQLDQYGSRISHTPVNEQTGAIVWSQSEENPLTFIKDLAVASIWS